MSHTSLQKYIYRLMALLLAAILVLAGTPMVQAAEGSCGNELSWSLDGSVLRISGSGPMNDYSVSNPAPWYTHRSAITQISLPEGLTRIGTCAFYECVNVASVTFPSTVSEVADMAFYGCSGLTMLSLNQGLSGIGESAFSQCSALADLRLPGSLFSIDHQAFYMCSSLAHVTIPGSVMSIGSGVFSYCTSLVHVDVDAAVTLPSWSFYGCNNLQTVTVQGAAVNPESLKVSTQPSGSSQVAAPQTTPTPPPAATESPEVSVNENISTTIVPAENTAETIPDRIDVEKTENATTIKTTQNPVDENTTTQITSTVLNEEGWQEVLDQLDATQLGQNGETLNATVYTPSGDTVEKEVLQELSGKNVSLTVQTQSGSQFTLDCTRLPEKVKKDLVLNYSLIPLENVPEGMEGCTVYQLTFEKSADYQVEMIMRLPGDHGYQTATLYRMDKKEPIQLQSVMVDEQSNAHWYLRSIDHKQEYLIGINIPGATTESPIIPAELAGIHKVANVYDGVEYVVTGRSSSWNMGLGRVMAILAAVMVTAIVVIGFVMYTLNRRRLKNGYMPDWSDDDEE